MLILYSWLKEYLGEAMPSVEETERLLTFHAFEVDGAEVLDNDAVFDVKILPNRGSDCLSHRGIARELASIIGRPLAVDPLATTPPELAKTDKLSVSILNPHACPRFTASLVKGVVVKESPAWLKARLEAIGQRSINNIVDATNYAMFALGQPLHAYDADLFPQVEGKWQFIVRDARPGDTVSLLAEAGKTEDRIIELFSSELLIVDGSSDIPIGLAGVKGGRYAGVHQGTKNIIIEAAHFHPTLTRQTARRLGIVIDASKRFENEPSRELPLYAQSEIIKLITDIAGGTFEGMIDEYKERKDNPSVVVTTARTNALLGLSLSLSDIKNIILRVGAQIVREDEISVTAVGPFERTDLLIEEDFIEEVGRLYGLENIASVVPPALPITEINARHYYSEQVRSVLLDLGFSEVITTSFQKKGDLQLKNAVASDKSYLRSNLKKNLVEALDKNFLHTDLLGIDGVRVFEIGTVFTKTDQGVAEHISLTLGVRLKGGGHSPKDDVAITTAVEALSQSLGQAIVASANKGVAEINFTELLSRLPQPTAYTPFIKGKDVSYKAPSVYPAVARDIALWVGSETDVTAVEALLRATAGPLCVRLALFDTFTKDNRTSYAFRLVFQSYERTLTDTEVNAVMEKIYLTVKEKGWEVR
ncbi:MAG: phenylalanine--tRNA ligase subunit beta [Patescibacteria group bacterium]